MGVHTIFWLFLVTLHSINLSINVVSVNGICLGHQQSLLLHLKKNLIFNPTKSKKLAHWNPNADCCQWNGIACSRGRVIALDLSEEFISGGFDSSSSLFSLKDLQNLSLAYNYFHSAIPLELQELKSLTFLNLSNGGFEGQIPIEISQLSRLAILDLSTSYNSSLKLEKPNVEMFLKNLTEIKELYLDGVRISAKGEEWRHAISSLQNLRVLSMSSCNLSGPIDPSLVKLRSLSLIRLNQNNMSSSVPESFMNLSELTRLELSSCSLNGILSQDIFKIQTLQVLDVSNNHDLHGSLPNFSQLGSLQTLNLNNTNFSGILPDSVRNLRQLNRLDLSNCNFSGTLTNSISELTQLVLLDLSSNNFTGPLPSFNMCKNLTYLSLFRNNLKGAIQSSHFKGLTNLLSIDLRHNNLNGSVPSALFKLPSLRQLDLSNNQFDGQLDQIPGLSSSLLEILSLSGNKLHGEIPSSFFHLRRLSVLQLSSNDFNGTIQLEMLGKLRNLVTLDLSHNNFSVGVDFKNDNLKLFFPNLSNIMLASCNLRAFPSFLTNQTKLLYLDLSNNQIPGTIPNWIWRLEFLVSLNLSNNVLTDLEGPFEDVISKLFVIDLHSNQLQGPIPILSKYTLYLDYSNNRFNSILPTDIGDYLHFAFFLYLSNNSLHGEIHDSLCKASNLRVLDLSNNNFSGMILECLSAMSKNLRVLNLGGNKLEGNISDAMPTSCSLRFLDLNGNFLRGEIPRSLSNCSKLQVLNLGNNLLTDRFPCFLKRISTFKILTLRSNKLHGSLRCQNSIGDWEMLQIVDLASNDFSGILSGSLLNTWKAMMLDEDEAGPRFGHLLSDIVDKYSLDDVQDILLSDGKDVGDMFAKILSIEPPSVIEHFVSDVYMNLDRYQDSVTIVNKGLQRKFVKIPTALASLDFSSNHFGGTIPEELMNFRALQALNLSHNAFLGSIPTSLRNLKQLESLDLSMNSLSGEIPRELANLFFLSFLNLSFNHLVGEIPTGTQIQSFEAASFNGNVGLCGPPLTRNCGGNVGQDFPPPASESPNSNNSGSSIDWSFLSAELGFTFGIGILILPLMFSRQWRLSYLKLVDNILCRIFPQLDMVYELRGGRNYRTLRWMRY